MSKQALDSKKIIVDDPDMLALFKYFLPDRMQELRPGNHGGQKIVLVLDEEEDIKIFEIMAGLSSETMETAVNVRQLYKTLSDMRSTIKNLRASC